jgi:hypothetical protein
MTSSFCWASPRRLDVEQDTGLRALTDGWSESLPGNKPPEDAVVGRFGQCLGHGGQSQISFMHWVVAILQIRRQCIGPGEPQV